MLFLAGVSLDVRFALSVSPLLEIPALATVVAAALALLVLYRLRGHQGRLLVIPIDELPAFVARQHELAVERHRHLHQ